MFPKKLADWTERVIDSKESLDKALETIASEGNQDFAIFWCADGEPVSYSTVKEEYNLISEATENKDAKDWEIVGWDLNEDPSEPIIDDHTGKVIPSLYGDDKTANKKSNNTLKEIAMGSTKKKAAIAIIYNISKMVQKDNFETGADPSSAKDFGIIDKGVVWSPEELKEKVSDITGIKADDFLVFEDGRITGTASEDEDGNHVDNAQAKKMSDEDNLYIADYDVYIKLGDGTEPTEDKMSEMFGLAKYGSKTSNKKKATVPTKKTAGGESYSDVIMQQNAIEASDTKEEAVKKLKEMGYKSTFSENKNGKPETIEECVDRVWDNYKDPGNFEAIGSKKTAGGESYSDVIMQQNAIEASDTKEEAVKKLKEMGYKSTFSENKNGKPETIEECVDRVWDNYKDPGNFEAMSSKKTADYRGSAEKFSNRNDYADYMIEIFGAESLLDQLIMAMGDDEAFKNLDYIAQMNDIHFEEEENEVEASKKTKKTADYQGYKNYETFIVKLHLDNEQGTQQMMIEWANEAISTSAEHENTKEGIWSADESAVFTLEDQIKEFVDEQRPELEGMYGDLLGGAIDEVDFREIAQHYVDAAIEEKKYQETAGK